MFNLDASYSNIIVKMSISDHNADRITVIMCLFERSNVH